MAAIYAYKKTTDNWNPSYRLKGDLWLVLVSFHYPNPGSDSYLVTVSGVDDYSMVKEFKEEYNAWICYQAILRMEDVTKASLKEMGFIFS